MTKQESGRLGGLATFKKHGKKHMAKIGKLGAVAFWTKYVLRPIGTANFAIVDRQTNLIVGYMQEWRM